MSLAELLLLAVGLAVGCLCRFRLRQYGADTG